ncbi:cellulase family glycosylhydrolase [Croceivirga thetidis]|uniref:mannan endo-1,4-beta-mannosidase n=1 Tax=Croceivirga thetidis TaxID=2721623 RepID=A0ABX1GPM1_9FLAO|nr:cellulase family glycosylhydrolase [Croceivirga thetidis]NKI30717.1 cellulase family glycosylhydrolase [Croceivirga thetidis]
MKRSRLFYRAVILGVFVIANFFILRGIGSLLAFVKSGADREQMMAKVLKVNDYYKPVFNWKNLENPGRDFIEKNQGEVQRDYTDSWYVKNLNQSVNTTKGIADFYTDSSRVNLFRTIEFNKKNDIKIHGTTLSHNIDINFFSADGKLVAFDDKNVHEVYRIFQNDSLVRQQEVFSDYKIVMLLEDGFWRIRHMVRSNSKDSAITISEEPKDGFVQRRGKQLLLNDEPFYIRGVNYYPKESPWAMFGNKFNDTIINQDFRKIDSLGFNTARIFVNYNEFGKEEVKVKMVEQLKRTLDLAEKNNLKLIVTLFDFFGKYDIINWTLTEQHLKGVVKPLNKHRAILAWDIKNEADLDMQVHSEGQVTSWLDFALRRLKYYAPNHLSTIGWLHPHPHFAKKSGTDIFTFHFYEALDGFEKAYDNWAEQTDKPLVVGEFGIHSWGKAFMGNSPEEQKEHYQLIMDKIEKGEKHFIAWTLYDFPDIPKEIFGIFPWRTLPQKNMGLLDVDGNPKMVMEVFKDLGISPNQHFVPFEDHEFENGLLENNETLENVAPVTSNPERKEKEVDTIVVALETEKNSVQTKLAPETKNEECNQGWASGNYLVSGAFGVQNNAKKQIAHFRSLNLNANCYFDWRKNLYYVVFGPYRTEADAKENLVLLKNSGVDDAWLLRK